MPENVWKWLLQAEWQGSLLIVSLMLVGFVLGGRFPARWRFALWLVVIARLLMPTLPINPGGIHRYVPSTPVQAWDKIVPGSGRVHLEPKSGALPATPLQAPNSQIAPAGARVAGGMISPRKGIGWAELKNAGLLIWAAGAIAGLIRLFVGQVWFYRMLRRSSSSATPELALLLRECLEASGIRGELPLMITNAVRTPAVIGLWAPRLLLPEDIKNSRQQLRLIFLHELAHLKRRDQWTNLAATLAGVIHWFNPLVWLAVRQMHIEREMAVDAMVLSNQGQEAKEEYGEILLSLLNSDPRAGASAVPMLGILESKSELKQRLVAIVRFRKSSQAWSLAGIGLLFLTVAIGFGEIPKLNPLPTTVKGRQELAGRFFHLIRKGDAAAVEEYVKRGVDVNSTDYGSNALFEAVTSQHPDIVRLFLSRGVRLNEKTDWGETCVARALLCGNHEIADLLIAAGAGYDKTLYLVSTGKLKELKALDAQTPLARPKILDALRYAANAAQADVFDWLLAKAAFGNSKEEQAKKLRGVYLDVVRWGNPSFLAHLEAAGVNPVEFGQEAFIEAVGHHSFSNRVEVVRHLLEQGVSATAKKPGDSRCPLDQVLSEAYFETRDGLVDIARLLIEHGADVNERSITQGSLVARAASSRNPAMMKLFLQHGADPKVEDEQGRNAAWSTACAELPEMVSDLVARGVDVKGRDKDGMTILHAITNFVPPSNNEEEPVGDYFSPKDYEARQANERETVRVLAKAGVDLNAEWNGYTPLMHAINLGHYPAAEELLELGASVSGTDRYGNTALALCTHGAWGQPLPIGLMTALLKKGANPNTGFIFPAASYGGEPPQPESLLKQTLCQAAIGDGERRVVARKAAILLLDYGATFTKPMDPKTELLLQSTVRGDLSGIKRVVDQRADINGADGNGWTALTVALAIGDLAEADWLIHHGASCKVVTREGNSPLYFAVCLQNESLVKRALDEGADPNLKSNTGGVLVRAIYGGSLPIFEALVKKGAKGSPGDLYSCIRNGQVAMARTLLDAGVPPEQEKPNENRGNVYWAVSYNQTEILKMLLDYGANPNLKDAYGETPLKSAECSHHKEMIPILKAAIKRWGEKGQSEGS